MFVERIDRGSRKGLCHRLYPFQPATIPDLTGNAMWIAARRKLRNRRRLRNLRPRTRPSQRTLTLAVRTSGSGIWWLRTDGLGTHDATQVTRISNAWIYLDCYSLLDMVRSQHETHSIKEVKQESSTCSTCIFQLCIFPISDASLLRRKASSDMVGPEPWLHPTMARFLV